MLTRLLFFQSTTNLPRTVRPPQNPMPIRRPISLIVVVSILMANVGLYFYCCDWCLRVEGPVDRDLLLHSWTRSHAGWVFLQAKRSENDSKGCVLLQYYTRSVMAGGPTLLIAWKATTNWISSHSKLSDPTRTQICSYENKKEGKWYWMLLKSSSRYHVRLDYNERRTTGRSDTTINHFGETISVAWLFVGNPSYQTT